MDRPSIVTPGEKPGTGKIYNGWIGLYPLDCANRARVRWMRARGTRAVHRQALWSGHRTDGDNFGDGRHQERRRHRPAPASHRWTSCGQLPALVVLQRMPVPVLAVGDDGTILFAECSV